MGKDNHIIKSVPLDFGTIELRTDNIITFEPLEHLTTLSMSTLQTMLPILIGISEGKSRPFFSNNYNIKSLGTQEKIFISENFSKFASAFAMTENSAITRFVTYTFMQLTRPAIPIKMFKTKEEAFEWLRTFNN